MDPISLWIQLKRESDLRGDRIREGIGSESGSNLIANPVQEEITFNWEYDPKSDPELSQGYGIVQELMR